MIVYWFLFFVIIILQFIPTTTDIGNKSKLVFSFLLMFIYMAIRGDFANDYEAYENIFFESSNYKYGDISGNGIEYGYFLLNNIMPSYRALIILLSGFTCFTYYRLFYKYISPKHYGLGFSLMAVSGGNMLFFQISGLRNAIVINMLALSIPLIKERKITQYIFIVVLAYFFHNSIVLFMPLAYLISKPHKIQYREILIWTFIVLFFIFVSKYTLLETITPFINEYFNKYEVYTEEVKSINEGSTLALYLYVLITFTLTFAVSKEIVLGDENIILKNSLLFVFALLLGSLNFRMSQYFAPYLVIAITIVANRVNNKKLKYAYLVSNIAFLMYSFYIFTQSKYFVYEEYNTIFN